MEMFKNTKNLTIGAMLLAVSVVLSFLKIPITSLIELRFNSLPVAICGCFFGPVAGGIVGALADILGYLVRPTGPFFPGFTITSALTGVIYGLLLYRKDLTLPRLAVAEGLQTIVISMLLNSVCLAILYGNGFPVVFTARIVKNLVMYPVNLALLFFTVKPLKQLFIKKPAA